MNFITDLSQEIVANIANWYDDNYDYYRFGKLPESRVRWGLKRSLKSLLRKRGFVQIDLKSMNSNIAHLDSHIRSFENLYDDLSDEKSRKLLVKLLVYRILGHRRVKLPTNTENYWGALTTIDQLANRKDAFSVPFNDWILYRYKLHGLGIPIELYFTTLGVYIGFILRQYEYHAPGIDIQAQKGDVVIDAGGCWGDTALYFANAVGRKGRVYSFEFIPSNLDIMRKNLSLNPSIERVVSVLENPLWCESGKLVYFTDNGPGSSISFDANGESNGQVKTVAIDDWAEANEIEKINFIKMDIEGAELSALKGAEQTIRKSRPKLAIAMYHSLEDFKVIPEYIASLKLGYKFFIGHYTIHTEETVLFATT